MKIETWSTRSIIAGTLVVAAVGAALVFVLAFSQLVFAVLLALTLSVAVEPLVNWLQNRNIRRLRAALLVYALLLVAIAAIFVVLVPLFVSQISAISGKIPEYYQTLRQGLMNSPAGLLHTIGGLLPPDSTMLLQRLVNTGSDASAQSALTQVANGLFTALVVYLLSFYWTLDNDRAIRFYLLRVNEARREGVRDVIAMFKDKVGAYLRGQTLLCVIVGAMGVIVYLLIGLPYAFSLGLVFGIFEAIPMIGPVIGLVPAMLISLAIAPDKLVWVIMGGILIQQLENNLLVPRVMDRAVGINPVVSILAIGAFTLLFGIPGAVLAVPMAAVIQVLLDRFIFSNPDLLFTAEGNLSAAPAAPMVSAAEGVDAGGSPRPAGVVIQATTANPLTGRDSLSVLHLDLHELTQDIRKQQRDKQPDLDSASDEIEDQLESIAERLYELIAQHISVNSSEEA